MAIRALFFDIDDTLYSTSVFADKARNRAIEAMVEAGLSMDHQVLRDELDEVIREFSSNYDHHFDKLLLRVPRKLYKGINPAIIVAAGVVAYHQTKFEELMPYEDAVEALERLSRTGLTIGVITEGLAVKQAEKLIRLKLHPYFDPKAIFISDQMGMSKANQKLYQRACSALNLRPTETVVVGDNPLTDIDPPNRIGMHTVRVRREGKHRNVEGESRPGAEVRSLRELIEHLQTVHGVEIPEVATTGAKPRGE